MSTNVLKKYNANTTHQKHYPDLGSITIQVQKKSTGYLDIFVNTQQRQSKRTSVLSVIALPLLIQLDIHIFTEMIIMGLCK